MQEDTMIQAKVSLTSPKGLQFTAETGHGHRLIIDDMVGHTGPKPIELMAAALAGCTAFDVATILRSKKHKTLQAYEVSVDAEQRKSPPQVFTDVKIHHSITGNDIDAESVEEAIRLSEEKYCSVGAMVRESGATITTTFSIQSNQDAAVGTVENHAA